MSEVPDQFRTDRFVASRIRVVDLSDYQGFYADPKVMSTMSADVRVWSADESSLWGEGVATEIARKLICVAFNECGLESLVGFTLPTNLASRRVLEKCSFAPDGEIEHAGLRHLLFRRSRIAQRAVGAG